MSRHLRRMQQLEGNLLQLARPSGKVVDENEDLLGPSLIKSNAKQEKKKKKNRPRAAGADEDEDEREEEKEETEEEEAVPVPVVKPSKKQKKKKGKEKKEKEKKEEPSKEEEDEEDVDALLENYLKKSEEDSSRTAGKGRKGKKKRNDEPANASPAAAPPPRLPRDVVDVGERLGLDARLLDADRELKALFGVTALAQERKESGQAHGAQRKSKWFRPSVLTKTSPDWPRYTNIGLVFSCNAEKCPAEWVVEETGEYKRATSRMAAAMASIRIEAFFDVLREYPYHIGTLFQVADYCSTTGDEPQATTFISQALYAISQSAPHDFSWTAPFTSRQLLHNDHSEAIFATLWRHLQSLVRRGCFRTSLEWCKLLYNLNATDPYHAFLLVDYLATKSSEWRWLIDLYESLRKSSDAVHRSLARLPQLMYGVAMARRLLGDSGATDALREAVVWYPRVVKGLIEKCDGQKEAGADHVLDTQLPVRSTQCDSLSDLYVERSGELWKHELHLSWLIETALDVKLTIDESKLPSLDGIADVEVGEAFTHYARCRIGALMGERQVLDQDALEDMERNDDEGGVAMLGELLQQLREDLQDAAEGMDVEEDAEGDESSPYLSMLNVLESEIQDLSQQVNDLLMTEPQDEGMKLGLTEMLTQKLLALDGIDAVGERADTIRERRKELIEAVHGVLSVLEALG